MEAEFMAFYDETKMESLRLIFEKEILSWKGITQKKMFSCPCVKVDGKLFAFLITNGIVLTKLTDDQKQKAIKKFQAGPFKSQNRTMKKWVEIPYKNTIDFVSILPYIHLSYENALKEK